MNLSDSIENLPYVGPTYAKRLAKLQIHSIENLLFHFPFRYDDFSLISPIARLQAGERVTLKAKVEQIKNEYTKGGKKIQKAIVSDSSGTLGIIWFNQPFLINAIKAGEWFNFSGEVSWFGREITLVSPEYEIAHSLQNLHTGRLVPIYPETEGVSSKWLRSRINTALRILGDKVPEFLPDEILNQHRLLPEKTALNQIHFPKNSLESQKAKERLSFDELFLIQLSALNRKEEWQNRLKTQPLLPQEAKVKDFIEKLSFELTLAQKKVIGEILTDLQKNNPMNRLLVGDVGSGKTVVAATAMYVSFLNHLDSLFMAPTEILANQHFKTLQALFSPYHLPVELVTSAQKINSKTNSQRPTPRILVGTHALLYQNFQKESIGLVVVDEQHRFGVGQRSLLFEKGKSPHFLTMTATPIPRTVALTLFGDLDLSVLDELPKGRLKVKTWVVPSQKRNDAYEWIRKRIKGTQEQAFIVCPLIEESETLVSVKNVTQEFEHLSKEIFPDLRLGLLHGRLKSEVKNKVLENFKEGKMDLLVATPVVEVGIDIPQATIMMIEGADRFGLAQLHQLRGRVGRNNLESYCLLFTENSNPLAVKRLKSLETNLIGMELAEIDLKTRGPGEIYGTRQHGFMDLKIASFGNLKLIEETRLAAKSVVAKLENFPPLKEKLKNYTIQQVNQQINPN